MFATVKLLRVFMYIERNRSEFGLVIRNVIYMLHYVWLLQRQHGSHFSCLHILKLTPNGHSVLRSDYSFLILTLAIFHPRVTTFWFTVTKVIQDERASICNCLLALFLLHVFTSGRRPAKSDAFDSRHNDKQTFSRQTDSRQNDKQILSGRRPSTCRLNPRIALIHVDE